MKIIQDNKITKIINFIIDTNCDELEKEKLFRSIEQQKTGEELFGDDIISFYLENQTLYLVRDEHFSFHVTSTPEKGEKKECWKLKKVVNYDYGLFVSEDNIFLCTNITPPIFFKHDKEPFSTNVKLQKLLFNEPQRT